MTFKQLNQSELHYTYFTHGLLQRRDDNLSFDNKSHTVGLLTLDRVFAPLTKSSLGNPHKGIIISYLNFGAGTENRTPVFRLET